MEQSDEQSSPNGEIASLRRHDNHVSRSPHWGDEQSVSHADTKYAYGS